MKNAMIRFSKPRYGLRTAVGFKARSDAVRTPETEQPRILSTTINEDEATASLDLAFEVAEHFGVKSQTAKETVREVGAVVADWRNEAGRLGLSAREIDRMASAFEHEDLEASQNI